VPHFRKFLIVSCVLHGSIYAVLCWPTRSSPDLMLDSEARSAAISLDVVHRAPMTRASLPTPPTVRPASESAQHAPSVDGSQADVSASDVSAASTHPYLRQAWQRLQRAHRQVPWDPRHRRLANSKALLLVTMVVAKDGSVKDVQIVDQTTTEVLTPGPVVETLLTHLPRLARLDPVPDELSRADLRLRFQMRF
jgi:hypothetical protein